MFSNRFYLWKLGGAITVIALMGVSAARRGDRINPMLWRCIVEPERWKDQRLWVPLARIVSVGGADFEIVAGNPEGRIRVVGQAPGMTGDLISLAGIFRADGPRLEMTRARVLPPHFRLRWLMEAISVLVTIGVLANFARHFLFRPKVMQLERES